MLLPLTKIALNQSFNYSEIMNTQIYINTKDSNEYFEKYIEIARLFTYSTCKDKAMFIIEVPRIAVALCICRKLAQTDKNNHYYPLFCKFLGEGGVDTSGLTKEMFSILDNELFSMTQKDIEEINKHKNKPQQPGLQIPSFQRSNCFIVSSTNQIMLNQYCDPRYAYMIGWYFAKAIIQNLRINSKVSQLIILLAMNSEISLFQLEKYDPIFANIIRRCQYNKDELDCLIDLLPQLTYKIVKIKNSQKCYYKVSVKQIVELRYFPNEQAALLQLRLGFSSVFPQLSQFFLNPDYICEKIIQSEQINVQDWKDNTIVKQFPEGSSTVKNFWELIEADNQLAKEVLQFSTGLSYQPFNGFASLGYSSANQQQLFNIQPTHPDNLPNSQTCTNTLRLPAIDDKEELLKRLKKSLQYQTIENP